MLIPRLSFLNLIFSVQFLVVGLVIAGVLPRLIIPFWVAILAIYILSAKLEDGAIFFARSIPFFVAIPITANFDSLNTWRILSGLIFLRWLFGTHTIPRILQKIKVSFHHDRNKMKPRQVLRCIAENKIAIVLSVLLSLSILSVTQASSYVLAVRRLIYFVNLALIGLVIYDLVKKSRDFGQRLIKNIAVPVIIVALVGMAQLASTYFMDIFQFVDFWAGKVELGLFGSAWANIAVKANTWFAYYGDQLSLRMFSLFPDSHSFPIFLLLGLPAVFAISFAKLFRGKSKKGLKSLIFAKASPWVLFVPLIFLAAILSGTRGIWVASIPTLLITVFIILRHRKSLFTTSQVVNSAVPLKYDHDGIQRRVFQYVASYLLIFFLLFGVAYYIFASDQFQVSKSDAAIFGKRVRSVIDISETSNARRLEIWKASVQSIVKHPLLGVGIGNFPVVVGEDLAQAKAGSSAHNLYLHIAAEMGIPALLIALWFLWLLLKKTYLNFLETRNSKLETIYFAAVLIFIPWVLFYSLTDVAIFDERAFLLFVITISLIFAQKRNHAVQR